MKVIPSSSYEEQHCCLSWWTWLPGGNCVCFPSSSLFIRESASKWELSQRMFTSGSAAPSATMGDTHITQPLAGAGKHIAARSQRERERKEWGRRRTGGKPGEATEIKIKYNKSSDGRRKPADETKQRIKVVWAGGGARWRGRTLKSGRADDGGCGGAERLAGAICSPPLIREHGCSDVCLAVKADRQIAASAMCWESFERRANDMRGENGRWLPSWKYTCITVPAVWVEDVWTFRAEGSKSCRRYWLGSEWRGFSERWCCGRKSCSRCTVPLGGC